MSLVCEVYRPLVVGVYSCPVIKEAIAYIMLVLGMCTCPVIKEAIAYITLVVGVCYLHNSCRVREAGTGREGGRECRRVREGGCRGLATKQIKRSIATNRTLSLTV